MTFLINRVMGSTRQCIWLQNQKEIHTTRLPFSKLVVYLRVQKSRAGASVVGA